VPEPSLNRVKPEPLRTYEAKARRCLMCRESFTSAWPGERVCSTCKTTGMWREGSALREQYD
jgi:hypothetical protein